MSTSSTAKVVAKNISTLAGIASTAPTVHEDPKIVTPIFLETKTAQVIAGIFVFSALFLTCQQVSLCHFTPTFSLQNDTGNEVVVCICYVINRVVQAQTSFTSS